MFVTDDTSQLLMSWLKELALENIVAIFVTEETSQSLMSSLKLVRPWNAHIISVTEEVSQSLIRPKVVIALVLSLNHILIAVWKFESVSGVKFGTKLDQSYGQFELEEKV